MFMPSRYSSYKISTPLNVLGSLEQDRRPAIVADKTKKAPMIPFTVRVKAVGGKRRAFKMEVFSNQIMTYLYMYLITRVCIRNAQSDLGDVTIKANIRLGVKGLPELSFTDYIASRYGGAYGFSPFYTRGFQLINFLLRNPFKKVHLRKVDIDVDLIYKQAKAYIWGLKVSSQEVEPGSIINVVVTLKRHHGGFFRKVVPVRIPSVPDGTLLRLRVQPGNLAYPDRAPPHSLADVLKFVSKTRPATDMVVTVRTAGEGTSIRGRLVTDLPGSVVDSLRSGTHVTNRTMLTRALRKVVWVGDVLSGYKYMYLTVKKRKDN
jgi:hypothetical protein